MTTMNLHRILGIAAGTLVLSGACSLPAKAETYGASAFRGCASNYEPYKRRPASAMVIGVSNDGRFRRCFYRFNAGNSGNAASAARRDCERDGFRVCLLFATTERRGGTHYASWTYRAAAEVSAENRAAQ